MVVHLFLNNNKALDFLPINSIKNGGITVAFYNMQNLLTFSMSGYALHLRENIQKYLVVNTHRSHLRLSLILLDNQMIQMVFINAYWQIVGKRHTAYLNQAVFWHSRSIMMMMMHGLRFLNLYLMQDFTLRPHTLYGQTKQKVKPLRLDHKKLSTI